MRGYRRIVIASIVTLLTSLTLLGLIGFTRWRGHQAVQSETRAILVQTGQQLLRVLQSRRGTLTFLRDTLNRHPTLTLPQLHAMGESAVEHTRHLLGIGTIEVKAAPVWWSSLSGLSRSERTQLTNALLTRTQLRGIWRVPSTCVAPSGVRPLLIMLEPVRSITPPRTIIGVFDLTPLLDDFFASTVSQRYPVQLIDRDHDLLYRSPLWSSKRGAGPPAPVEHGVSLDAAQWIIQMQPGTTPVVQTLSWFTILLIGLGATAGVGIVAMVWMVTTRTWMLQRAVARRTAALRRASARLRQLATTDELTGLYNRRFFLARWAWECERAKRYHRPLACLMVDVNNFKHVNDAFGHLVGDLVLQQVAQTLKTLLRQSDIVARFGGDEFIVALPETDPSQAERVAEKLRGVNIPVPGAPTRRVDPVSLSVGMSRIEANDESPTEVLEAADHSLYADKKSHLPLRS